MLEQYMIENCAPTLAGLKSGNLFSYRFASKENVLTELEEVNFKLNSRGVSVEDLQWKENMVLIYAYRRNYLERDLQNAGIRGLLEEYGYQQWGVEYCLQHLKSRLYEYDCFPHEIGVFLGYPLEDVKGFIQNKGREYKCCGLWKVYDNELEAQKLFEKLRKCTRVYLQVFAGGRSISQMTVSA